MATFTRICGAKDGHSCGEVHWFVSAKTSTVAERNWCAVHFEWGWIALRVRAALCNPASGSARKHLPFPHSSVRCSISTRAQSSAAHSARRGTLHKSTTTGEDKDDMFCSSSSTTWFSGDAFGLSFRVIWRNTIGVWAKMRITFAYRVWWCPRMNAGWLWNT